ncbi:MAG: DoxX family membrane protein [Bacteroidaceae bacterium]|nr:DoxX family membrane protein [Bacteroidaceae bacterium]
MLLACTFVFSGLVKLIDPRGTEYKLEDYAAAFHVSAWMPDMVALGLAVLLAIVEFCLGIYLFFGIRRRFASLLSLVMLLVLTPLTLYLAIENPVQDCGCFGDAVVLTNWQTFWKNVVLLLASVAIIWRPRWMTRFISERNQWAISLYSIVFAFVLALYNLYHLPVVDFRPYSVGTDLPAAIAEEWEKGETAHYADFSIYSEDGDDLTMDWLSQPGYKFLLVAPYMEQADDGTMERINALYEYCEQQKMPFLCLTSSTDEAINQWSEMTGAEYPFAMTDGVALKTVVRSNPGLVMLRDGVVAHKWAVNDLPVLTDESLPMEEQTELMTPPLPAMQVWVNLLLWYVLPIVLFAIADGIWVGTKYYRRYRIRKYINNQIKRTDNEKENCCR